MHRWCQCNKEVGRSINIADNVQMAKMGFEIYTQK